MIRIFAIPLCFLLAAMPGPAQGAKSFAVVSVKEVHDPDAKPAPFRLGPGGIHVSAISARTLILAAYRIDGYQLSGGDSWLSDSLFSVDAATDAPATTDQVMAMLRGLLATRFSLRLAHTTKKNPAFALVVAKGGPKFHELAPGEVPSAGNEAAPDETNLPLRTITDLVFFLNSPAVSRSLGRAVVDETGLDGNYNLWLTVRAEPKPDGSGTQFDPDDVPSGLRRLGLSLRPTQIATDYYTIQSAAKPASN